jgi:hypothetical protein
MNPGFKQILHGDYRHSFLHAPLFRTVPAHPLRAKPVAKSGIRRSGATPSLYLAAR